MAKPNIYTPNFSRVNNRPTKGIVDSYPEMYQDLLSIKRHIQGQTLVTNCSVVIKSDRLTLSFREERDTPILSVDQRKPKSYDWKSSVYKGETEVTNHISSIKTSLGILS